MVDLPERFLPEKSGKNADEPVREMTFTVPATPMSRVIQPGDFITTITGKKVLRVVSVASLGIKDQSRPTRYNQRFNCLRVRREDVPEGVQIHNWPTAPAVARRPSTSAPPGSPAAESLRRIRDVRLVLAKQRAEQRARTRDGDPLIPAIRKQTIIGPDGEVIRGPTVDRASWRDPEDMNVRARRAKEIDGYRSHDELRGLASHNKAIEDKHLRAAERYQECHEAGPGGARPGYEPSMDPVRGFGPGSLAEARIDAMTRWHEVQAALMSDRVRSVLDAVVIRNRTAGSWGKTLGWSTKQAVGHLVAALDLLVVIFRTDEDEAVTGPERR